MTAWKVVRDVPVFNLETTLRELTDAGWTIVQIVGDTGALVIIAKREAYYPT